MCGQSGLTPKDAKELTFNQFIWYLEGYFEQEDNELERARLVSFYSVSPHSKKIKRPKQLFKLNRERLNEVSYDDKMANYRKRIEKQTGMSFEEFRKNRIKQIDGKEG